MTKRIKNIFHHVEKPLDAIVLKNSTSPFLDDNFFYVTGLKKGIFEECLAVLYPDGSVDILVSTLEAESARMSSAHICVYKNKEEFDTLMKHLFSSLTHVGVNFSGLLYHDFLKLKETVPNVKFTDVSESFHMVRLIKDEQELQLIKKACSIADIVMEKVPDFVHDGISEDELAAEIEYHLLKCGADKPAFDTISSFQKNSTQPHYTHGATRLKKGDIVLCDFGACYTRYNSDITRTFVFGKSSEQQQQMYKTVAQAQQIGFDMIQPGIEAHVVHDAVSTFIEGTIFKGRFIHSTGHSLGLAVHDGAVISADNTMILQENMVLTVEPGVYIPGYGGVRIEDDILIKKDKIEILTHSSRKLKEIK